MNDIDLFLQLPISEQAAVVCFVACSTCLFVMLLAAPQWDCFFLRWRPETRFLALLAAPTLLILWPVSDHLKTYFFGHPPRLDRYPLVCYRGCGSV